MERKYNKSIVSYARELRNNMTKEERHLWYDYLKTYPVKFSRQKVLGKYVADFYSAPAQLVIELDGSQHYTGEQRGKDAERTSFLEQYGIQVIRFTNFDINENFSGVCLYIDKIVKERMK